MENILFEKKLIQRKPYLYNFALKLTRSHQKTQDLIQETYFKAWKSRTLYKPQTKFKAWIFTIMRNSFINNYRKNGSHRVLFDTNQYNKLTNDKESNTNMQESILRINEINDKISELKSGVREAFLLYLEGFKYKEISTKLNLPLGTVKSRIFFARKHLSSRIKKH
ncbi:RNA polymerase sigma factor [Halosquirtibacter laminarini]|uniref:RNA polymerase sigma factor n=1 Tax=Halosquirtibacter laminarini TaxID=3374600 RepID=A0AC61NIX4_9BACT|nr:RNA polymerase sigma factor [Prolixibacteraceae bacterium]